MTESTPARTASDYCSRHLNPYADSFFIVQTNAARIPKRGHARCNNRQQKKHLELPTRMVNFSIRLRLTRYAIRGSSYDIRLPKENQLCVYVCVCNQNNLQS